MELITVITASPPSSFLKKNKSSCAIESVYTTPLELISPLAVIGVDIAAPNAIVSVESSVSVIVSTPPALNVIL